MSQTTRIAIRKGFLELLEQRPLDKISVVDIAEHCGVNRNTFYYYYCDIYALETEYGILTRCGLHCAPSAHRTLGTFPQGTVRFSLGFASTEADVDAALHALRALA